MKLSLMFNICLLVLPISLSALPGDEGTKSELPELPKIRSRSENTSSKHRSSSKTRLRRSHSEGQRRRRSNSLSSAEASHSHEKYAHASSATKTKMDILNSRKDQAKMLLLTYAQVKDDDRLESLIMAFVEAQENFLMGFCDYLKMEEMRETYEQRTSNRLNQLEKVIKQLVEKDLVINQLVEKDLEDFDQSNASKSDVE